MHLHFESYDTSVLCVWWQFTQFAVVRLVCILCLQFKSNNTSVLWVGLLFKNHICVDSSKASVWCIFVQQPCLCFQFKSYNTSFTQTEIWIRFVFLVMTFFATVSKRIETSSWDRQIGCFFATEIHSERMRNTSGVCHRYRCDLFPLKQDLSLICCSEYSKWNVIHPIEVEQCLWRDC